MRHRLQASVTAAMYRRFQKKKKTVTAKQAVRQGQSMKQCRTESEIDQHHADAASDENHSAVLQVCAYRALPFATQSNACVPEEGRYREGLLCPSTCSALGGEADLATQHPVKKKENMDIEVAMRLSYECQTAKTGHTKRIRHFQLTTIKTSTAFSNDIPVGSDRCLAK